MIFSGRNRVTQPYGGQHTGIDIVGDDDSTVRCVHAGKVEQVYFWDGHTKTGTQSYGNLILIHGDDDKLQYYAHLKSITVRAGQYIRSGQAIGTMGNTGNSFGAHTHFEIRSANRKIRYNPADYLGIPNKIGTYTERNADGWTFSDKKFRYFRDGSPLKNQWVKSDGWWYYLGADGIMQTGYISVKDEMFYLNENRKTVGGLYIPEGACIITDERGKIIYG